MTATPLRLELRTRLESLGPEWDRLVSTSELPSPFLKSWWVDHAAGGEAAILCCFEGSRLVGGAAFELDHVRRGPVRTERVRCVGQGELAPDHLDLIAAPGHESDVLELVLGWLRRPGSRLVDLDGLAATGSLAQALVANELDRIGAPYTPLPSTGEEYLASRPGQLRSTITRARKRFAKEGVQLRRVEIDDIERALDQLAALHDERWSEESDFLRAWDRCRAAAVAGAALHEVVIHELVSSDGEVVATELDLRCGPRLAFYQAGRRIEHEWRGCGSVLRAGLVDRACAEGLDEYDLLRGDERYKADWAGERRELVHCRVGVGVIGRSFDGAERLRRRATPGIDRIRVELSPAPWRRRRGTRDELSD